MVDILLSISVLMLWGYAILANRETRTNRRLIGQNQIEVSKNTAWIAQNTQRIERVEVKQ